jgi:hypothetical protein
VSVEDLFDDTRDRWQRSYRYPLIQRFLWLLGVGAIVAAVVLRSRLQALLEQDPRVGYGVVAVAAVFVFACFWKSLRAWECKILVSPTSIKAWYLLRGRERVSWDSMERLVGKWRLFGHSLTIVGTDGAQVRMRSSLSKYDEVLSFIRNKAPKHIVEQLDAFLAEDEDDAPPKPQDAAPEAGDEPMDETEAPEETREDADDEAAS